MLPEGISKKQSHYFQKLAEKPDIIENGKISKIRIRKSTVRTLNHTTARTGVTVTCMDE